MQCAVADVEAAKTGIERTRNFAEICIQLKWPPPWHMPARVIDRITVDYQAGDPGPVSGRESPLEFRSRINVPARIGNPAKS